MENDENVSLLNYFMDANYWLPKGLTWNEVNAYSKYSIYNALFIPLVLSIVIYFVRFNFEKYIGFPLGVHFKLKKESADDVFKPNGLLEVYFADKTLNDSSPESIYMHISRETNLDVKYIKKWFNRRKHLGKPSMMKKFTEATWRCSFYLFVWTYGLCVLWDEKWLWDLRHCWYEFPRHELNYGVYWYYVIELAFYFSLLVSQFFDVKRKDFWQMFAHHVVTILLLQFSYMCNYTRIGSVILLLHDIVDILLEGSKVLNYLNQKILANCALALFALLWLITRIIVYPTHILNTTWYDATEIIGHFQGIYIFNFLLFSLQVMHIIWFSMIVKVTVKVVMNNGEIKDDRSESDFDEATTSSLNEQPLLKEE